MTRYVVRPKHIRRTPSIIAGALGAVTRRVDASRCLPFDLNQDFFMAVPASVPIGADPSRWEQLNLFSRSNKASQRVLMMGEGITTPDSFDPYMNRVVVRPYRHMGGVDYTVQDVGSPIPEGYYASNLFPKTREYRVVYHRGQVLCTYLKKLPPNVEPDIEGPWNHDITGATFMTVTRNINDKLLGTMFYTDMARAMESTIGFDYLNTLAVDVLYCDDMPGSYAVCEFNLCPGITIQNTIDKLVSLNR